jgi:hypothetical protein
MSCDNELESLCVKMTLFCAIWVVGCNTTPQV